MNRRLATIIGAIIIATITIFFVSRAITAICHRKAAPVSVTKVEADKPVAAVKAETDKPKPEAEKVAQAPQVSEADIVGDIKKFESQIEKSSTETEGAYFSLGELYEKHKDPVKAKDIYKKIIEKFPTSANIQKAQESLDNANIAILFSQTPTPDSFMYEVQPGDMLNKIARKNATTPELIMRSNNLKDTNIKFGRKLKIMKAKFSITVDKSQNILMLKKDGDIFKTYKISTGKDSCTPVGTFKIINKIINPVWYTTGAVVPPESPKNILGTRWMGIDKEGYGIHGTTDPDSLGKSVTSGCVRMKNSDVEELYIIVPVGTEVVIAD